MTDFSILIVDDSPEDRYLLKRRLNDADVRCRVFEEGNGQDAINLLQNYDENRRKYPGEFPPLVVYLDINMPLMNGFEFLEQFAILRNEIDLASIVIMMFTSSEREEDMDIAYSFEFVKGHVVKGDFTAATLKVRLEEVIPGEFSAVT